MSLGIALAGGGLKGTCYIGVFKALEELNIKIDYLSGASSGSLIASMYAMGYKPEEMKELLLKHYKQIIAINKLSIIAEAKTYLIKKKINMEGLIPGEKIENLVNEIASKKGLKKISDVKLPFAVATVDTITTKECIFLSRKYDLKKEDVEYIYDITIGKAVRASMAFPGIFTTCSFEKYNFIDGGTKDNLPVEVLKDMGADKTIGINFNLDPYDPEGKNIFDVILRATDIFSLKDVLRGQKKSDLSITIDVPESSLLSMDNIDKNIKIGYDVIMKNKEKILDLQKGGYDARKI